MICMTFSLTPILERKQKKNVFSTVLMIFNLMIFANFKMQKFEYANIVNTTNDAKNEKQN